MTSVVKVELTRQINVKFDVQKMLDAFPEEWAAWKAEGDEDDPDNHDVEGFVRETVAEIGFDLLDFNDWVIPEPMYDVDDIDVRFRDA
jgi:hypothetical protein